jgi:hypothetical protein
MKRRRHARKWPPKGSYPHPAGGHIIPGRPKNGIRVTGHLKAKPDFDALAKAFIELAQHLGKHDSEDGS